MESQTNQGGERKIQPQDLTKQTGSQTERARDSKNANRLQDRG